MVAQVIKLPTVATNNFQSGQSGISVESVKDPAQNVQAETTRAKKIAEQAAQNVQAETTRAKKIAEQAAQNIKVVNDAAKVLNEFIEKIQTNLSFSVDKGSDRLVITVTDTQTGDVIRQIPAKEILAVANLIRAATAADIEKVGLLLAAQG